MTSTSWTFKPNELNFFGPGYQIARGIHSKRVNGSLVCFTYVTPGNKNAM
jgi:hypothetical protein